MARRSGATPLYLDAAATTATCASVRAAVLDTLAAAPAEQERRAQAARERLAALFGAQILQLTASGTEANNLALLGLASRARSLGRAHVISQPTEHPSVLRALDQLARAGFEVELLPVSREGRVRPADLEAALRPDQTAFVSIMRANHETGALQPTRALGDCCRAAGVPLHVDAVQSARWLSESLSDLAADALTVSAHKLDGPKGVGLLVSRDPIVPPAERADPAAWVGLAEAVERRRAAALEAADVAASRDALQAELEAALPGVRVNGRGDRLPGHLNLSIAGLSGEALVVGLDQAGVAASSGAACASGTPGPSPVLSAMGRSPAEATGSLRLTLPRALGPEERARVVAAVTGETCRLRSLAG